LISMILSNWLPTLLGGALAVQGALALDINIGDESWCPAFQSLSPCGLLGLT
jgi:mannan endo-1,6-alpha-mannosidase